MKAQIVRIGNSRGIRIPQKILGHYGVAEGQEIELEERRDGILLRPIDTTGTKISWEASYGEMVAEKEEAVDWSAWETTVTDGIND
jgi:antitoxin MazE